jgi:hypothetical protein
MNMDNSGNYNFDVVHNMETDQDDLDLLDFNEWNSDSHIQDQSSVVSQGYQFDQVPQDLALNTVFPENSLHGLPESPSRKPVIPTISTIYEPKFFEIFQAYNQHCLQYEPTIKNQNIANCHLMTLCLNNLLPFSQWAREADNALFIRVSLFENPDMRPEVRNGLAMILVYVFSAAKANDMRATGNLENSSSADMFTVLMKSDTGFGIVNKTSLKIYSDPYGFFNFLKVSKFLAFLLFL